MEPVSDCPGGAWPHRSLPHGLLVDLAATKQTEGLFSPDTLSCCSSPSLHIFQQSQQYLNILVRNWRIPSSFLREVLPRVHKTFPICIIHSSIFHSAIQSFSSSSVSLSVSQSVSQSFIHSVSQSFIQSVIQFFSQFFIHSFTQSACLSVCQSFVSHYSSTLPCLH